MDRERVRIKARSRPIAPLLTVVPFQPPQSDDVLAALEVLMDMALSGSLKSVAIAGTHHDGAITTAFANGGDTPRLMGALSVLNHRLNRRFEGV